MEVVENPKEVSRMSVWKFVVNVRGIKVGVVVNEDLYDEEFKYYKLKDDLSEFNEFDFDGEELEDDVLSEDEKYEIFDIWRS